ncbi:hypothetical protein C8J56DRAFT_942162 [Mycena floridula]|nr:hypothetical protein C8J56DRAFT_942162 [Mycena floridula]
MLMVIGRVSFHSIRLFRWLTFYAITWSLLPPITSHSSYCLAVASFSCSSGYSASTRELVDNTGLLTHGQNLM